MLRAHVGTWDILMIHPMIIIIHDKMVANAKNLKSSWRCRLGVHNWAVWMDGLLEEIDDPTTTILVQHRRCRRCGIMDVKSRFTRHSALRTNDNA